MKCTGKGKVYEDCKLLSIVKYYFPCFPKALFYNKNIKHFAIATETQKLKLCNVRNNIMQMKLILVKYKTV